MLNQILPFDGQITLFLSSILPRNKLIFDFFSFFSLTGSSILIWAVISVIILIIEEKKNPGISKKDKFFMIIFTLSILSTVLIVELPLKNFFRRPRPSNHPMAYSCPKSYSFPSGHSATAFTAATVLSFFDKKRKWLYYSIASLIAYSRIYLGCHYFFDVVLGATLGIVVSRSTILLASLIVVKK